MKIITSEEFFNTIININNIPLDKIFEIFHIKHDYKLIYYSEAQIKELSSIEKAETLVSYGNWYFIIYEHWDKVQEVIIRANKLEAIL